MEKFVDKSGYGLVRYESKESKKAAQELKKKRKKDSRLKKYEERKRARLPDASYGSIIRVDVDIHIRSCLAIKKIITPFDRVQECIPISQTDGMLGQ